MSGPRSSGRRGATWSSSSSRRTPGWPASARSGPVNKTDSFVATVEELAGRYVIGADPFDTEKLAWAIERLEYGRPSEHGQSALAAFDIACFDLIGQQLGVPVWKLLGGRFRDRVPAYANGWYQADYEPARIAELAAAWCPRVPGDEARPVRGGERAPVGRRSAACGRGRRRRPRGDRTRHRPDDRDARAFLARHRRPGRGRPRAIRPALARGAGPAREREGPGVGSGARRTRRSRPASGSTRSGTLRRSSRAATSTSSRPT